MASSPYVVFSSNVATYSSPISLAPSLGPATSSALRIAQSGAGQALDVANTGASNALRVRSGSDAAALLVDASGRIGVGTAAPSTKFHLQGSALVSDALSVGNRIAFSNADASASVGRLVTSSAATSAEASLIVWLPFMNHLYDQVGSNYLAPPSAVSTSNLSYNPSGRIGVSLVATNPSAGAPTSLAVLPLLRSLTPTQPAGFTVAAWIKPYTTSTGNRQFFFGSEGGFGTATITAGSAILSMGIEPTTNNLVALLQQSSGSYVTATSATAAANNTWTHVAAVFSGATTTLTLYANGAALNNGNGPQTYTHSATLPATMANLILFTNYQGSTTGAFNGEIDDLRIYSRALTANEVATLAADTTPKLPAVSTNSLALNGGPLTFNAATTLDGVTTNASNLATAIQLSATDYTLRDLAGAVADPLAACQGTVVVNSSGPFAANAPGEGSLYINNSNYASAAIASNGSYFAASNASVFGFNWWQSGGFTAEAFVRPDSVTSPASQYIMGLMDPNATTHYWSLSIQAGGLLNFSYNNGATVTVAGTTAVASNTWSHLAVSCDAGTPNNIRLFVNGNLDTTAAVSGTPVVSATAAPLTIGQWNTSNAFSGYISNARITRGAALYTASFTPSTTPLPSPARPSTTPVLHLRAAQFQRTPIQLSTDGTVTAAKVTGTVPQVRQYPPRGLTDYVTNIQNTTYGTGYYIVTASSEFGSTNQGWKIFDTATTSWATSNVTPHNYGGTGAYNGSSRTLDTNGTVYLGEWVQLQMPAAIVLSSYSMTHRSDQGARGPSRFFLLGSTDGLNWTLVSQQSAIGFSATPYNFPVPAATRAFNYFRLVVNRLTGSGPIIDFNELLFFGTPAALNLTGDGRVGVGTPAPALPMVVAGDAYFTGNIAAGNVGMFRNRIINGDMRIAQRGTSTSVTAGTGVAYPVDRLQVSYSITTGGLTLTQQTLGIQDQPFQYGFRYAARVAASTANSSYTYINPLQRIEGLNISDLNWGYAFGTPITVSFWMRTNMAAGSIVSLVIRNDALSHSYVSPITVTNSAVWQYVSAVVPQPPVGSIWLTDTNAGMIVSIGGYQPASLTSTVNAWVAGNFSASSASTNWYATLNNYIDITGLQVEKGTLATPFEFRPYALELALCRRYYEKSYEVNTAVGANTQVNSLSALAINTVNFYSLGISYFKAEKRTPPASVIIYSTNGTINTFFKESTSTNEGVPSVSAIGTGNFRVASSSAITANISYSYHFTADAEL